MVKFDEGDMVKWKHPSKLKHRYIIVKIYPRGLFRKTNVYLCINEDEDEIFFYEGELEKL